MQVPGSTGMGVAVHGDGVGIPSRDLDRGAGLRLQQLRLALAVWRQIQFQLNYFGYDRKHLTKKYYQVPISVVLIVTKPVIITAGRYGVIQMQIQTHKRSTNRLRRNLL